MTKAPPRPWVTGTNNGHTCTTLEVKIVEDALGWVFSEHGFASPEDATASTKMKNGGVHQIAYALTTEALRREVYLCLLAEMSKHPNMLQWFTEGDDAYREAFRKRLAGAALASLMGLAQKMLPDIAREVVEMGVAQLGRTVKPPPE